jgi:hypothetical protein
LRRLRQIFKGSWLRDAGMALLALGGGTVGLVAIAQRLPKDADVLKGAVWLIVLVVAGAVLARRAISAVRTLRELRRADEMLAGK